MIYKFNESIGDNYGSIVFCGVVDNEVDEEQYIVINDELLVFEQIGVCVVNFVKC